MSKKAGGSAIRLIGSREQIQFILSSFEGKFAWRASGHFYPRIGQPGFYSYYLDDFWPLPPA